MPSVPISFQGINKSRMKVRYRLCLNVALTTPDSDYIEVGASEFSDEVGPDIVGYAVYAPSERRPIQILKRTTTVFFH
jgi:hypothetical protein